MTAHAKYRPPSSARRWLSCPASASVMHLYPNNESDASLKGTLAHNLLDAYLTFGLKPDTDDPDMDMHIIDAGDWIKAERDKVSAEMFVEVRLDIPQTGEFGTADTVLVSDNCIHVIDFKNGYVPVEHKMNAQMLVYLLGAIERWGERKKYKLTVIQPNYDHINGTYRTWEPTESDLDFFHSEINHAMRSDDFQAGKHCKSTYCEHRGNCATFQDWAKNNAADAFYPHEVNALTDDELAVALDHADTLHGLRDELRKQAIIRIMKHDRRIKDFKCVKSRSNRDFAGEEGRQAAYQALLDMGYSPDEIVEKQTVQVGQVAIKEQKLLSVAGVERLVKQKYKHFGRGKWKGVWDELVEPHVRNFSGTITLERSYNGRPSVQRGSEFTSLTDSAPQQSTQVEKVNII